MEVWRKSPDRLVVQSGIFFTAAVFIFFGMIIMIIARFVAVSGELWFIDYIAMGAAAFLVIGAYALTNTRAVFCKTSDTITIYRRSFVNLRGETYPLAKFQKALLHNCKNKRGKKLFAIALKFDGVTMSDIEKAPKAKTMEYMDIRGIPDLGAHEFPLTNYAESTGRRKKERVVNEINAWLKAARNAD